MSFNVPYQLLYGDYQIKKVWSCSFIVLEALVSHWTNKQYPTLEQYIGNDIATQVMNVCITYPCP